MHLTHVAPTACGLGIVGLCDADTSLAKGTGAVTDSVEPGSTLHTGWLAGLQGIRPDCEDNPP
jgi:hypothetical protein